MLPLNLPSALDDAVFTAARQQWTDQGYSIIEGVLARERCEALAGDVLAEYERAANAGLDVLGGALSGHLNCFPGLGAQALVESLERAGVTEFASEVFGAPLSLRAVGCNCNLPGSHYQHFHADSPWSKPFLIVNVMLVDTDLVNGATELIAGSDRKPLPYWRFVASRLARRGVRHRMKSGDVLIRSSRLWHRGTPNRSDRMRPMMTLIYFPSCEHSTAVDYDLHGGRVTFIFNMFKTGLLGRLNEVVAVYLPGVFAIFLSAKSLVREP